METKVFPASFPDDFEARVETLLRIYHVWRPYYFCNSTNSQAPSEIAHEPCLMSSWLVVILSLFVTTNVSLTQRALSWRV